MKQYGIFCYYVPSADGFELSTGVVGSAEGVSGSGFELDWSLPVFCVSLPLTVDSVAEDDVSGLDSAELE